MGSTATVRIQLLGPVELLGADADLGGTKVRRLLALLALRAGEVVPTDTLVDVMWPDEPPADPQRSLQVHVSNLRRALDRAGLDAAVEHRRHGYMLTVERSAVDVRRFEALVQEGRAAVRDDPARAAEVLREALGLWRGRPLGGFDDHDSLRGEVVRLEDLRLQATEARIAAELATGRDAEVTSELRRLVDEHPLREGFVAQLMVALYRSERQAESLEVYDAARRRLADELGVDPSPSLRELHRRILDQDEDLAPQPVAAPSAARADTDTEARAIAVLPFDVIGGADEATFLAMGLHNDLLTELSKVPELTVISRTSVLSYRGTSKPVPTIARELRAGTVVEGTVQSVGQRFRLTVQLIDGRADVHRWAESYDRELTTGDLFAIQSELARDIAGALHTELAGAVGPAGRRPPTDSLEAYELAARARQQFDLKTEGGFSRAIELYEESVALDPDYAGAWVGLADALASMEAYGHGRPEELLPRVEAAVDRALELDPNSAEARTSLGVLRLTRQEGPGALRAFEEAMRTQPSYADAHNWHSWISLLVGRAEDGLHSALRAVELDPLSAEAAAHVALGCAATGDPGAGLDAARRARRLSPYPTAAFYEGICLLELGRHDEAEAVLEPLTVSAAGELGVPWAGRGPDALYALALADRGEADAARAVIDTIDAEAAPFAAGFAYLAVGDLGTATAAFGRVRHVTDWPALALHHYHRSLWAPLEGTEAHEELVRVARRSWGMTP